MSQLTPTYKPIVAVGGREPLVSNLSVPLANTEVSLVLQTTLKGLIIRARDIAVLKLSFVAGQSGITYFTVSKGNALELTSLDFETAKTLYLQTSIPTTVEIIQLYS